MRPGLRAWNSRRNFSHASIPSAKILPPLSVRVMLDGRMARSETKSVFVFDPVERDFLSDAILNNLQHPTLMAAKTKPEKKQKDNSDDESVEPKSAAI